MFKQLPPGRRVLGIVWCFSFHWSGPEKLIVVVSLDAVGAVDGVDAVDAVDAVDDADAVAAV